MARNHIHIAMGLPGDKGVISGMRAKSDVYIFLDGPKILKAGVKLFKSTNNVILCEGDETGSLSLEFFLKVTDSSGNVLL
jgi:2'-phosphotransferase